jgi:uncharacterized protein YbbC (DUF1343 family)
MITGTDRLIQNNFVGLENKSLALLVNQSSVDSNYKHLLEHFAGRADLKLKKIFAPEHGLFGGPQDMEGVQSSIERITGVPIVSLYDGTTESLAPSENELAGIDILLVDLPDVGSRYYTYAQTTALTMAVAEKTKTKVIILDRPNPIDGVTIEGSPLKKDFRSFCGMLTVPQRHGLTLGELAVMYQKGFGPKEDAYPTCGCELEVIKCEGWSREQYIDEAKGTWVIPSPNMPTLNTAIVYPGGCLFEGTNISEARGTTLPFEYIGAPFIDGYQLSIQTLLEGIDLEGAVLRPVSFIPKFQKWANQECGGVQIHITDRKTFKPFRWGLALISAISRLYPGQFKWRTDTYEFINHIPAIDLLYGSDRFRKLVDQKGDLSELIPEINSFESWYIEARKSFLLY